MTKQATVPYSIALEKLKRWTEAWKIKNNLGRQRKKHPKEFFNVLRVHNKCLNTQRKLNPAKNLQCQETAFQVNPWHFAKKSC